MGCLNLKITRLNGGEVKVRTTPVHTALRVAANAVQQAVVSLFYDGGVMVKVNTTEKIKVSCGLVCATTFSDELEMWWTEGWKALWNNRTKILWREE